MLPKFLWCYLKCIKIKFGIHIIGLNTQFNNKQIKLQIIYKANKMKIMVTVILADYGL